MPIRPRLFPDTDSSRRPGGLARIASGLLAAAVVVVTVAAAVPATAGSAPSWTAWGGPGGDFKLPAADLATTWPESGPRQLWSRELGAGYSSILVEQGRLYTVFRRGDDDVATALDAATGKTLWEFAYPAVPRAEQGTDYGSGPHAAPLLAGHTLVTITANAIVHGIDRTTGKDLWSHDLIATYGGAVPYFGYAIAPIFDGGRVIVLTGGKHGAVGLDPKTGAQVWASEAVPISYGTPMVIEVGGERQLTFMTPDEVVGIGLGDGPGSGKVRWRHPHKNQWDTNCIGPWWGSDGLLFVSTMGDAGSRTLKLTRSGETTTVEELSANNKFKIAHNTALRFGDHVYAAGDELIAYELKTGTIAWREEGYKKANLVAIGERVLALDEDGKLSLLRLAPDKLTVDASHALLTKPAWTAPTVIGTTAYLRDQQQLVALDLAAGGQPAPDAKAQPDTKAKAKPGKTR